MEPKWGLGAVWGEDGSREAKKVPGPKKITPFWSSFWRLLATFFAAFFQCVFGRSLFRLLGDFWMPKGPERLPKWSQNGAGSEPGGTLWEV